MSRKPVITIDGPGGTGKSTIARLLAQRFGWCLLDSGALYRVLGLAAMRAGLRANDEVGLVTLAQTMDIQFSLDPHESLVQVFLAGEDVSQDIRTQACGQWASKVAVLPKVREALLQKQRDCAQSPGLVTDGRDMGTVVFPKAELKIFLQGTAEARAKRRYKQLREKGINVNLDVILSEQAERDKRDSERMSAPLVPAVDAVIIDTTLLSLNDVVEQIAALAEERILT